MQKICSIPNGEDNLDRVVYHRLPSSKISLKTKERGASISNTITPYNCRVNNKLKLRSVACAIKTFCSHNIKLSRVYLHPNSSNNLSKENNYKLMQVNDFKTKDNFKAAKTGEECWKSSILQHKTNNDCGRFVINFKKNRKEYVQSSKIRNTDEEEFEYIISRVPKKRNPKFTCLKQENSLQILDPKSRCKRAVPGVIAIEKFCRQQFKIDLLLKKSKKIIESPSEITSTYLVRKQCSLNTQMGYDIISRLRQLLNFNPSANQQSISVENNRKRRSEDSRKLITVPQHFKYRKVDNIFPKYIASTADIIDVLPSTSNKLLNNLKTAAKSDNFSKMPLPPSINPADEPNFRKSMFAVPEVTQMLIKNSNDSSIELSDYDECVDEPIFVKEYKSKKTHNKPCGNVDCTPAMQRVKRNLNQATMIQSNRLSFPEKYNGFVVTGRNSIHKNFFSGSSTLESSHNLKGLGCVSNISLSSNTHSILVQERQAEERQKYQQLLQKVMPRLYGKADDSRSPQNFILSSRKSPGSQNTTVNSTVAHASPLINKHSNQWQLKHSSLLSSINLDDDELADNVIIHEDILKPSFKKDIAKLPTYVVDDGEDRNERNISKECKGGDRHPLSTLQAANKLPSVNCKEACKSAVLPQVARVNSFQEHVECVPCFKDDWLKNFEAKWSLHKSNRLVQCQEAAIVSNKLYAERRATENEVLVKLNNFKIIDVDLLGVDDTEEAAPELEFFELSSDQRARINAVICGPPDQVLVSKFNLNITRRDIHTLCGHNWLNDEVINFYMNLLTERGDRKHQSHGLPTVYAMNTFFIPRLMQAGYAGVKRWTRKVDIFAKDIIPVPVHVGGVHWCMAIIHIKQSSIKYYDSMGTPNPTVLKALEQYLKDESLDKHKQTFDTTDFVIESVADVPRQMNGSDCGVFSCMFAEYITRNKQITFTQQNMEFFRQKMMLEIIQGELLQ